MTDMRGGLEIRRVYTHAHVCMCAVYICYLYMERKCVCMWERERVNKLEEKCFDPENSDSNVNYTLGSFGKLRFLVLFLVALQFCNVIASLLLQWHIFSCKSLSKNFWNRILSYLFIYFLEGRTQQPLYVSA